MMLPEEEKRRLGAVRPGGSVDLIACGLNWSSRMCLRVANILCSSNFKEFQTTETLTKQARSH